MDGLVAQPITVDVTNEAAINSPQLEFSPTFYEDGIVFLSSNSAGLKKNKDSKLKMQTFSILRSKRNETGALQTAEPFSGIITSKHHEGPVCFNATGDVIYFSSNIFTGRKPKKAKDGEVKMKIYTSTKLGEVWSTPVELPFNSDGQWNVCHPMLSIDGDRLIFASDQEGGIGGMDLYVSYKVGDSWAEPINLGNKINTTGNDVFPFLHADNTLYYSSDTRGKGGLDIFYAVPEGADYTSPINIGPPFNTAGDDFGLIVDLNKINGYFTSNGNGGAGADEILSLHTNNGNLDEYLLAQGRVPKRQVDMAVNVFDINGKSIPNADVKLVKLDQGAVIGRDSLGNPILLQMVEGQEVLSSKPLEQAFSDLTDANGRVLADLNIGNYAIIASKKGYQSKQLPITLIKPGNEYSITLEPLGDQVRFNTVLFNDQTNAPLAGAMLIMTNRSTGLKDTVYTDENGGIDYYAAKNTDYQMDIYQNGKLIGESSLSSADIAAGTGNKTSIKLSSGLKEGSIIELPNIYYNFNDATLRPDAKKDLDPVVALLNQYPKMRIRINSYTDSRGAASSNKELSTRRAKSVLAYLTNKGIKSTRLEIAGYGETKIRNQCIDGVTCDEKDHARNRRTELEVLSGADADKVTYIDGSLGSGSPKEVVFKPGTKFYLVAGSFLMSTRANTRLNELIKAGFDNASIVQFPKSPFYSVCVDKLDTYEAAQILKTEFFGKTSIESFVRPQ
jgi:outer membrane protein OmpA-like peptidoglycan-associated protein